MTMWPPIYLVDDVEDNRTSFKNVTWSGFMTAIKDNQYTGKSLFIPPESQRLLLSSTGQPSRWECPFDSDVFSDDACNAVCQKLTAIKGPSILLLDYQLRETEQKESSDNDVRRIITAYGPSAARILVVASRHADAMDVFRQAAGEDAKEFIVKGDSLGAKVGLYKSLGMGIGRWLELNDRLYDRFIEEIIRIDHQSDEALLACFMTASSLGSVSLDAATTLKEILHSLACGRSTDYRALWLLTLVVFKEMFPQADPGKMFDCNKLEDGSVAEPTTACIPFQLPPATERKSVLLLFGELCRKLLVHDATKKCTLMKIVLSKSAFALHLSFLPTKGKEKTGMAYHVSEGVKELRSKWAASVRKHLVGVCGDRHVVIDHHETTDLLIACWLAFQYATSGRNPGQDFFGGARLSVRELLDGTNTVVGTEVSFHG